METTPARSTRLENLRFAPSAAHVEFDGKPVELAGDGDDEAVRSFQAFYWEALKAFEAQATLGRPAPPAERGFSLGSLFRPKTWIRAAKNIFSRVLSAIVGQPAVGRPRPAATSVVAPAAPESDEDAVSADRVKKGPAAAPAAAAKAGRRVPRAPTEPPEAAGRGVREKRVSSEASLAADAAPEGRADSPTSHAPANTEALMPTETPASTEMSVNTGAPRNAGARANTGVRANTEAPVSAEAAATPASDPLASSKRPGTRTPGAPSAAYPGVPAESSPEPGASAELLGSAQRKNDGPALRAAFADERGVHLLWLASSGGKTAQETELVCAFDSPVASRLQECYASLARLGHPIVDLQVWRKGPQVETAAATADAGVRAPSSAPEAEKAPPSQKSDPSLPDRSVVMRLHPGPSDPPGRAVVSPVGDDKSLQVLAAPERLIDALHAAADPSRPAAERVTYLRCTSSRTGLKVIAVGTGEDKSQPRAPARWDNVSSWWEAAKKNPAPVPAPTAATTAPRAPAAREPTPPSPALPKPHPELF